MGQTHTVGKRATTVATSEGWTRVTYHSKCVVRFNAQFVFLNTGGWETVTTKARMNQASNQYGLGFQVYQKDYEWFVSFKGKDYAFGAESIGGEIHTLSR